MDTHDSARTATRRLLEIGDDDAPLDALEALPPVETLPAWAEALVERVGRPDGEAPVTPEGARIDTELGDDRAGPVENAVAPGRILRFPRRRVAVAAAGIVAALAAAAGLLVWAGQPPTSMVPVDTGALAKPVASIMPPPRGGSAFTGDRERRWSAVELGYRFEAVADWEASASAEAQLMARRLRRDLEGLALGWTARRGIYPDALTGSGSKSDRLRTAREALDGRAAEGFELGRWLYLLARHRADAGPPPPESARNAAALAAWVGETDVDALRVALAALTREPEAAPTDVILSHLVGLEPAR